MPNPCLSYVDEIAVLNEQIAQLEIQVQKLTAENLELQDRLAQCDCP